MKNIKNMKMKMAVLAGVAGLALYSTNAMAVTQSMTANIAFDTAITLTKNFDINFGFVTAGQVNTYALDTAGAVTVSGAGTGVWLGGTKVVGNIKVNGSATQTIDVIANNYAAAGGVTPSLARCKYGAAAEASCNTAMVGLAGPGGGAGTILLVGISAAADGTQAAGATAAPTFDIVVTYT